MTKQAALETAKANHKAHMSADIERMFRNGPAFDAFTAFGYRHGWYIVGDYSFSFEDVTGQAYDMTQGGWAYL